MQKTSFSEIQSMKLLPNKVLVRLTRKEDEILLDGGQTLFIDPAFNREMHTPTIGEVVNFCPDLDFGLMPWKTTCEIKLKDTVVFNYLASTDALVHDTSQAFMDEKKHLYIIINYQDLFASHRKKQIIPLNGYVLCKPVNDEQKKSKIIFPEIKKSDKIAEIAVLGTRIEEYYDGEGNVRPELYDPMWVGKPGDKVVISRNCNLNVEYDLHQTLMGRKQALYYVRRCYIRANISNTTK